MAIIPSSKYTGQIDTSDPTGYPQGKAQNVSVAGDGTGTPLEQDWVNDLWGFLQALLDRAGITPSTNPDKVGASDYLDSLSQWIGTDEDLAFTGYEISVLSPYSTSVGDLSLYVAQLVSIAASDDGGTIFTLDASDDTIHWWTMSTPFDVTTLSHQAATLQVSTQESSPTCMYLKPDGTALYVAGDSDAIYKYTLPTAYSLVGASYASDSFDYSAKATSCNAITFKPDGNRFYVGDSVDDDVHFYTTASAWTVAGATFDETMDVSEAITTANAVVKGLTFNDSGTKLIVLTSEPSGDAAAIHEYTFRVDEGFTQGSNLGVTKSMPFRWGTARVDCISFADSGTKIFVGDAAEGLTVLRSSVLQKA